MKQRIVLKESDLHNIIRKSVEESLLEARNKPNNGLLKENKSSCNEIQQAKEILVNLTKSTFIPFVSPSPSGTEMEVKKHIFDAIRNLNMAIDACEALGY